MKNLKLWQTLKNNLAKLDSERSNENTQIIKEIATITQNFGENLKTNYTRVWNTNKATMKDYSKWIQATQDGLKNSYLELEKAKKEHNKTMQTKLQELEKQIHKNLAKKSLLMPLTFIMGLVIMGAISMGAYFLIILPYKNKELELSQKEVFQLKREIDQLNNANLQRFYQPIPTKK
uniref:MobB n=1 Tax=Helicobacter pylori TaxID=210 RepID=Q007S1_HELPX|nr:MobB [Helicobacter pylori]